jgi:hypothetical protein
VEFETLKKMGVGMITTSMPATWTAVGGLLVCGEDDDSVPQRLR